MAKRNLPHQSDPKPPRPTLPPARALELLRTQWEKGGDLLRNRPITSDKNQAWETVTRDVLSRAFGPDSPNVSSVMDVGRFRYWAGETEAEWEEARANDMATRLTIIQGLIELLETDKASAPDLRECTAESGLSDHSVFLVHGHNEAITHEAARFLERLALNVTVLREEPNAGRTIIEKFIHYSNVGYAVVLLTADDRGGTNAQSFAEQKPRARQNVILELGFFLGKLGRNRVGALYQEGVEIPSDYSGVLFVPLDDHGAWKLSLAREMKAVGLNIDMNEAM